MNNFLQCYNGNISQISLNLNRLYDIDLNNLYTHAICMTFGICHNKNITYDMYKYVFNHKIRELSNNELPETFGHPISPIIAMEIFKKNNYIPNELSSLSINKIFPIPLSLSVKTTSNQFLIAEEIYFFDLTTAILIDKQIKKSKYNYNKMSSATINNIINIGKQEENKLLEFKENQFKRKEKFEWEYNHSLKEWAISGLSHTEIIDRYEREMEDRTINKNEEREMIQYVIKNF